MEVSKASVGSDSYAPITQRAKASR
jgi:hypothetical protein